MGQEMQWTGRNVEELQEFAGDAFYPPRMSQPAAVGTHFPHSSGQGWVELSLGDYIVRNDNGFHVRHPHGSEAV